MSAQAIEQTQKWLREVILGLELCPFARQPVEKDAVRYVAVNAKNMTAMLTYVYNECSLLDQKSVDELETTLLIVTDILRDFREYNEFLGVLEDFLKEHDWEGVYQIASFHPEYQFQGTAPADRENYTNRSPYPIFHLIREASLEKALACYPDVESIPEKNIHRIESLSEPDFKSRFAYLANHLRP